MVERIRTLLESRQLTPTQFADLIGVARPIISHILSGRNKPSLDVVQRILAAMPDLSMGWLLNGTEPMLTAKPKPDPATLAPSTAEAFESPVAASSPPVAAASIPISAATHNRATSIDKTVNQAYSVQKTASGMLAKPFTPGTSAATVPVAVATAAPSTQPISAAASRPPMPRRFSVGVPVADQPASPFITATPTAPAPPVPEGKPLSGVGTLPLAVATGAIAAVAAVGEDADIKNTAPPAPTPTPPAVPVLTLASDMASALFSGAEKPIRRIVIFYRDGSFADYQPE